MKGNYYSLCLSEYTRHAWRAIFRNFVHEDQVEYHFQSVCHSLNYISCDGDVRRLRPQNFYTRAKPM